MAISNASNQIVKVNLIPGIIPSVLHLSQYDTGAGRPITFSVYDGSQAFTIPSGVSIAFEGTKPDGKGFSFTCSKSDSNALLTNYTNQMTALPGKIMCQLVFTDTSGGRVGSLPVLTVVTPAGINGDTIISDSDIEAIVAAQNAYAALNARLDAAIDQMNTTTNKAIDQMNTKANDLQNQYAVTNAKLDTAISAATQDSEVQDIRVKADGTSAATAGNAVREQITELKNDFTDMIDVSIGDNLTNPAELYGAVINNDTGAITSNAYYVCSAHIPCTPGETLYILWRVSDSDIRVRKTADDKLAFYKEDGTFISIGYNEDSYTVPELAAYCIQQGYKTLTTNGDVAVFRKSASELERRWRVYTETKTLKYSYTPKEVIDGLNEIDTCMKASDYLDYSLINRLNPSDCEIGKIVDLNTGELDDGASYFTTGYIPIYPDETLYIYITDGNYNSAANRYAAFDANKNVIPSLGTLNPGNTVQQTGEMAYIRLSFPYVASDIYRTPDGVACMANAHAQFIPRYGTTPIFDSKYIRKQVNIYASDTESEIITKLIDAYNTANCDVYFERAIYSFGTELEKVSTDYGMQHNEIPIGHNCRYYFNGATIEATIDLSRHPTGEGEEEFYCNLFGSQRMPSPYELHDGVLIATDTRYIVHDESSALPGTYKHLYENMEMHYHTNARQEAIRKCIGGGTGVNGVVEIIGCVFSTDGTDSCVSYHGNSRNVEGAQFDLSVRDSWFSNSIRAGALSASQTARLLYTGNSAMSNPATYDRWTVISFLNELRQ